MGWVKTFFSYLKLKEHYKFNGSASDLTSRVDQLIDDQLISTYYTNYSENELEFHPRVTGSTLVRPGWSTTVSVFLKFEESKDGQLDLEFTSTTRFEHLLILLVLLFGLSYFIYQGNPWNHYIAVTVVAGIVHFFTHYAYRSHERSIVQELEERLGLYQKQP